jgi:hypothetical protein
MYSYNLIDEILYIKFKLKFWKNFFFFELFIG